MYAGVRLLGKEVGQEKGLQVSSYSLLNYLVPQCNALHTQLFHVHSDKG